jgi:hypothetical protein
MKQPSEKQMNFANKISNSLNKPVPTEKTAQAYFLYISENLEAYQEKEARLRAAWKKIRRKLLLTIKHIILTMKRTQVGLRLWILVGCKKTKIKYKF